MAILITGGSTGIGAAIAEHFGSKGAEVFINYNANAEGAQATADKVQELGGTAHLVQADVGDPAQVARALAEVREKSDRLDQIAHCAARAATGKLVELDHEVLTHCIAVNGLGLVSVVREALPILGEGSSIFYISSRGAEAVIPDYSALGLPKALGEHIVRYLAAELAPRKIRAFSLSPGAYDTPAFRAAFPDTHEQRYAAAVAANRMGRALTGADVGGVIEALSRPEFEMAVGERIRIDGGVYL